MEVIRNYKKYYLDIFLTLRTLPSNKATAPYGSQ